MRRIAWARLIALTVLAALAIGSSYASRGGGAMRGAAGSAAMLDRFVLASDQPVDGPVRVLLMDCRSGGTLWRNRHGDALGAPRSNGAVVYAPDLWGVSATSKYVARDAKAISRDRRLVLEQTVRGFEVHKLTGALVWRIPTVDDHGTAALASWNGNRVVTYEQKAHALEIRSQDPTGQRRRLLARLPWQTHTASRDPGSPYSFVFAVSRDERLVAIVRSAKSEAAAAKIVVINRARRQTRTLRLLAADTYSRSLQTLAFSPDGRTLDLEFASGGASRFELRTGRRRELLSNLWRVLAVSENRRYAVARDGSYRTELFDFRTGRGKPVRGQLDADSSLAVSRTGEQAVFSNLGGAYLVDRRTRRIRRIHDATKGRISGVALSPDGHSAAVTLDHSIDLVNLKTHAIRQLARARPDDTNEAGHTPWLPDPEFDHEYLSAPQFSPDGTRVAFVSAGGIRSSTRSGLVIIDLRGGGPVYASEAEGIAGWSPDGRWIAIRTLAGTSLIDTQTGNEHGVTQTSSRESPVWAQDSSRLYLSFPQGIESLPIDGSTRAPIRESPPIHGQPIELSPDGTRLRYIEDASGEERSVSLAHPTDDRLECAPQPRYALPR